MANQKVYGFNEEGFSRVQRAVRQVLGAPTTGARRRRQSPVMGNEGGGNIGAGGSGDPYTTAEYDAISGEVVARFDRGRQRNTSLHYDLDVLLTTAGNLFGGGTPEHNPNSATTNSIACLWDANTVEKLWDSNRGALSAISAPTAVRYARTVIESSDGFLWVAGTGAYFRIDPDTGDCTHRVAALGGIQGMLHPCPTAGCVVCEPGPSGGNRMSVIDASGAATFNYGTAVPTDSNCVGGKIILAHSSGLESLDASNMSSLSTRGNPPTGGAYVSVCTDGTTAWALTSEGTTRIRWYGISSLGTEVSNATMTSTASASITYNPIDGNIYFINATNVRRVDPSSGAVVWTATGIFSSARICIGFGSDFIIVSDTSATAKSKSVYCLEQSSGDVRWYDHFSNLNPITFGTGGIYSTGVHVSADDRIFVGGNRQNP